MPLRRELIGDELDARIVAMHDDGVAPADIAHDLVVKAGFVRDRLVANGIEPRETAGYAVHPMWKGDDDHARRRAIWEKQQQGAKQRLREMRLEDRRAAHV